MEDTQVISPSTPTLALSVLPAAQYILEMQPAVLPRWPSCAPWHHGTLPNAMSQNPTLQFLFLFFTGKILIAVINCSTARTTEL